MAYINYSGAESGDMSEVYASGGTSTPTASSSSPKSGTYSYDIANQDCYLRFGQINADGSHGAFSKVIGTDVFSVGFWWRAPTVADLAANTYVLSIQDTSNVNLIGIVLNTTGTLRMNGATATPSLGQTGATYTPSAGTWYYIEVTVNTLGGSNANWYVNGALIANVSLFSVGFGSTACWAQFGYASGPNNAYGSGDPKFDDLYISDTSSARYSSNLVVANSVPRAAGASAQWTTGTSALFSAVDEVPHNSDTDYIGDATSADASSFAMQSVATLGITGATIAAVKTVAIVRDEAGGAESVKVRLRNGSTNRDTTGADPGSSYVALARLDETDPNTSTAWTTGGFDTIEGGVVNNASVAARATAIYAMVLYTPVVLGFIFPNRRQSVAVQRAAYW